MTFKTKLFSLPTLPAFFFGVLVLIFLVGFYIFGWSEPSANPPERNVAPPINVSGTG